jgi:transglutaminase/protease-like cytokinesis protein 3
VAVLHDWVAGRIAYVPGGPSTAQQTFDERRGVCAGYSALLRALADAANEDVSYVVGTVRDSDGHELGAHAWNLARIDRHDEPIDVTWDAGYMVDGVFEKRFSRHWLFMPPTEFAKTHVPDD